MGTEAAGHKEEREKGKGAERQLLGTQECLGHTRAHRQIWVNLSPSCGFVFSLGPPDKGTALNVQIAILGVAERKCSQKPQFLARTTLP